jgi:TonB family protein
MFKKLGKLFGSGAATKPTDKARPTAEEPARAGVATSSPSLIRVPISGYKWRHALDGGIVGTSGAANLAQASGMASEAFGALRLDLALVDRAFGTNDPLFLDMVTSIAHQAAIEGAWKASDSYTDRVIALAEEVGDKSRKSNALMRRGQLRWQAGLVDEAQTLIDEAVVLRREALGADHSHVAALADFAEKMRSGETAPPDLTQVQREVERLLDDARHIMPTRRMYMAEAHAREALNIAYTELGSCSAEALAALRLVGEILLSAHRPNAALKFLLHACDVAYVRGGAQAAGLEQDFARVHQAIEQAPLGDHDPEGGCGVITVSLFDPVLHDWVLPRLNGFGGFAEDWPAARPLLNTVDSEFASGRLRAGGDATATVSFAIGGDGTAQDVSLERSSGDNRIDQAVIRRMSNLRFAPANAGPARHRQDIALQFGPLDLDGPEAALLEEYCMVVEYASDARQPDRWTMALPGFTAPSAWSDGTTQRPMAPPGTNPPKLLQGSINGDDYPSRALRAEREGTVKVGFTVTREGRAEDLFVAQSSGHEDLDEAAIKAIQRRFRYAPATDASGEPIEYPMEQVVRWKIDL